MQKINELKKAMIEYFCGDAKRIQHFIKVHSFSKLIGEGENLDEHTMFILESSALVHDIGIKISRKNTAIQTVSIRNSKVLPKLKKC